MNLWIIVLIKRKIIKLIITNYLTRVKFIDIERYVDTIIVEKAAYKAVESQRGSIEDDSVVI